MLLKCILNKDRTACKWIYLAQYSDRWLAVVIEWTVWFSQTRRISWVAARMAAFRGAVSSMKLTVSLSCIFFFTTNSKRNLQSYLSNYVHLYSHWPICCFYFCHALFSSDTPYLCTDYLYIKSLEHILRVSYFHQSIIVHPKTTSIFHIWCAVYLGSGSKPNSHA